MLHIYVMKGVCMPNNDDYCSDCASIKKENNLCDEHYDILERE